MTNHIRWRHPRTSCTAPLHSLVSLLSHNQRNPTTNQGLSGTKRRGRMSQDRVRSPPPRNNKPLQVPVTSAKGSLPSSDNQPPSVVFLCVCASERMNAPPLFNKRYYSHQALTDPYISQRLGPASFVSRNQAFTGFSRRKRSLRSSRSNPLHTKRCV
jgi:hypothetical protein